MAAGLFIGGIKLEDFSVFDIVGPRMTGPSSSHTAGAVKMALLARRIAGGDIVSARFILYGSFAETGRGHGTDKALIAGALGMEPDDGRIRRAYQVAREMGVDVSVDYSGEPSKYPNTALMRLKNADGREAEVTGVSIGGGNILITEINGLSVELTGDYPTLIARYIDAPGVIAEVSHVLAQLHINIAFMRVFRHGKGEDAYMTVETDEPVTAEALETIRMLCPTLQRVLSV